MNTINQELLTFKLNKNSFGNLLGAELIRRTKVSHYPVKIKYDEERDQIWVGMSVKGHEYLTLKSNINPKTYKLNDDLTVWGAASYL